MRRWISRFVWHATVVVDVVLSLLATSQPAQLFGSATLGLKLLLPSAVRRSSVCGAEVSSSPGSQQPAASSAWHSRSSAGDAWIERHLRRHHQRRMERNISFATRLTTAATPSPTTHSSHRELSAHSSSPARLSAPPVPLAGSSSNSPPPPQPPPRSWPTSSTTSSRA